MKLIGGARAVGQANHRARPTEMSRDYQIALFMPNALWKHCGSAAYCSYFWKDSKQNELICDQETGEAKIANTDNPRDDNEDDKDHYEDIDKIYPRRLLSFWVFQELYLMEKETMKALSS